MISPLLAATVVLLAVVFAFRLEWMFPALDRVVAVAPKEADLTDDDGVMLVTAADPAAGVSRRNLIMEDDVSGTLWQQATGRAIYGPHAGAADVPDLPRVDLPLCAVVLVSGDR